MANSGPTEDRLAIREVIENYADAVTRRDGDAWAACWAEDRFIKGRYLDRFEKRDGVWKIAHRRGLHDFERIVAPADLNLASAPPDELSRQAPDDPIYAMLASIWSGEISVAITASSG